MKRSLIFIAILFLFIVPMISAIEFDMAEEFKQGETLTARLSGSFTDPPLKENIEFFRGHVRIALDHDIAKIGSVYYIFASLTDKEPRDDYSIVINEVEYRHQGKTTDDPLRKNFTITESLSDFSINPGFISTNGAFSIIVDNLGDEEIEINLEISTVSGEEGGIKEFEEDDEITVLVLPGIKTIKFNLASRVKSGIKTINLYTENQTYEIPVSIFIDETVTGGDIFAFDIKPNELEIIMPTNSNLTKLVYIYNTGTGRLTDVKVNLDESLKPWASISEDSFGQILPTSNANFELSIESGGEQSLGGDIMIVTAEGIVNSIRVSLKFEAGYTIPESEQQQDLETTDTCEEIGGQVCIDKEECTGDSVFAKNQFCCVGNCVVPVTSSWGKIIGWVLVIIVIVVGIIFFKNYKKAKGKPVDLLKVARGKK